MLIAKLRISLIDASIQYNRPDELGTDKDRGAVLPDGKVVRGLGTHFANQAAKERFDRLTKESNLIREKFNRRFMRSPLEGVFVISKKGEAKEYVAGIPKVEGLEIYVTEFQLGGLDGGLDDQEMRAWGEKVKTQLSRIPLGRGKELDDEGIKALEALTSCPMLKPESAEYIRSMIAQLQVGKMDKIDFKRGIELMSVEMDQSALTVQRSPVAPA
jgi:hypothetical protein